MERIDTDTLHFLCQYTIALALPLGELSPQVTERVLRPRDVICLRRCRHFPIGHCYYLPSPSSLRSAASPIGRGKGCRDGNCFTTTRHSLRRRFIGVRICMTLRAQQNKSPSRMVGRDCVFIGSAPDQSAFLAVSTRTLNASGSAMASSDRALRFISMPDCFRPYMKRE